MPTVSEPVRPPIGTWVIPADDDEEPPPDEDMASGRGASSG